MRLKPDKVELILQSCLERIQFGQETIDSVLTQYPHLVDVLRPELETALWLGKKRKVLDPRAGFVYASRGRLIAQVQQENRLPKGLVHFWSSGLGGQDRSKKFTMQIVLAMFLMVVLVTFTSGFALASQSAIPVDALYPVKIAIENAELAITPGSLGDARLHIEFAQRRLAEVQSLVLEGKYGFVAQTVTDFEHHVNEAVILLRIAADQNGFQAKALATSLQETLVGQAKLVAILAGIVPPEAKTEMDRALEISRIGIVEMQGLVIEIQSTGTPVADMNATQSLPTQTYTSTPDQGIFSIITPTFGFIISPTVTTSPTDTFTPTFMFLPTNTATPRPRRTQPPPTDTLVPTWTFAPTSTSTPHPPTYTPTPTQITPTPYPGP